MRIYILARRWGGPNGGSDGMSIAVAYLAWTLAQIEGNAVRCFHPSAMTPPWRHSNVQWTAVDSIHAPADWNCDCLISAVASSWPRLVRSAEKAGAKGKLLFWHHHGDIPTGMGCRLASVAPLPENVHALGWSHASRLRPASWAIGNPQSSSGRRIVIPGVSAQKGGAISLEVVKLLSDLKWYALPGRATDAELLAWRKLPNVMVADRDLQPGQWIDQAALVFLPTQAETYGLAMVEAAVCGIPVVTSDLPGPRAAMGDYARYLSPAATAKEWALAIRAAIKSSAPAPMMLSDYRSDIAAALEPRICVPPKPAPKTIPPRATPPSYKESKHRAREIYTGDGPVITVSVPFFRSGDTLRRAVGSILNQSEDRLRVIVVNDGDDPGTAWMPLAGITDSRLVRFDLPQNRGRYFADAVTLAACDSPWWSPHDADDWSEPDRLSKLLAISQGKDVIFGDQWVHGTAGRVMYESVGAPSGGLSLRHYAHMAGLWNPEWLRGMCGPHPGWRMGYDTVLSSLAYLCGNVGAVNEPLYHRCRREGSLTTHSDTDFKSKARTDAITFYRDLWKRVVEAAIASGPASVAAVIAATISDELAHGVAQQAARLRQQIVDGSTHPRVPADALVVTVLTGGRPEYLDETLRSARSCCPELANARVVVFRQGIDPATDRTLLRHAGVIDQVVFQDDVLPIGEAIGRCAQIAQASGCEFWLHLEDDWQASSETPGWLARACNLLRRGDIYQVRLRHSEERVLPKHMATGKRIVWQDHEGYREGDAHLTFNPALLRVSDIEKIYPCSGERDAQKNALNAGLTRVAQIEPGVWRHIGESSLRLQTRCQV